MDHRQGPLRVRLRARRDRITYPRVRDEDGDLRAGLVARGLRGRRARARRAPATPAGPHRRPAHRRGRLRVRASSPASRSAPTTSTSAPARSRAEEADFLGRQVAGCPAGGDLRRPRDGAGPCVLVGLEPEEEAGAIFLRLRTAHLARRTPIWSVAAVAQPRPGQARRHAAARRPGEEAAVHRRPRPRRRRRDRQRRRDPRRRADGRPSRGAVRGATAGRHDRRASWPGCRAGPATGARSRPAACPTCCPAAVPSPTPPRASTSARPGASTSLPERGRSRRRRGSSRPLVAGDLGGLVVGGVDPDDTADPAATRAALAAAPFVVASSCAETEVTRRRRRRAPGGAGDREGRHVRHLGGPAAALRPGPGQPREPAGPPGAGRHRRGAGPAAGLPHRRRGAHRDGVARPLGRRAAVRRGRRSPAAADRDHRPGAFVLATWQQLLDDGSLQDGEDAWPGTAAPAGRPAQPRGVRRARRDRHPHR